MQWKDLFRIKNLQRRVMMMKKMENVTIEYTHPKKNGAQVMITKMTRARQAPPTMRRVRRAFASPLVCRSGCEDVAFASSLMSLCCCCCCCCCLMSSSFSFCCPPPSWSGEDCVDCSKSVPFEASRPFMVKTTSIGSLQIDR